MGFEDLKSDLKRIELLTRDALLEKFPLFRDSHLVKAQDLDGRIWVGYTEVDFTWSGRQGHSFDLNIFEDLVYLVGINLNEKDLGKGFGWKLYESVHEVGRKLGIKKIRTTPSGGYFVDDVMVKSRMDYLLERGYVKLGESEAQLVLN